MRRSVLIAVIPLVRSILTMVSLCAMVTLAEAQELVATVVDQQKAAKVKAVYLYTLSHMTKWPESALNGKSDFTIGVIDSSLVQNDLTEIANRKKSLHDRQIKIRSYSSAKQVKPGECEVLFISSNVSSVDVAALIGALRNTAVLTVTETDTRPTNSIVNFLIEDEGIHFEINNEEAQRKELAMDARLLRQGRIMQNK